MSAQPPESCDPLKAIDDFKSIVKRAGKTLRSDFLRQVNCSLKQVKIHIQWCSRQVKSA